MESIQQQTNYLDDVDNNLRKSWLIQKILTDALVFFIAAKYTNQLMIKLLLTILKQKTIWECVMD